MREQKCSIPFVQREVTLYTHPAQDVVGYLNDIDRSISRAENLCSQVPNGNFERLERLVNDIFQTFEDDLKQAIRDLDARCAEARTPGISYPKILQKTVKFTNHWTFRFIDLLISFDTLMRSGDKLRFAEILKDSEYYLFQKSWRIKLLKLKKNLKELGTWKKINELFSSPKDSSSYDSSNLQVKAHEASK